MKPVKPVNSITDLEEKKRLLIKPPLRNFATFRTTLLTDQVYATATLFTVSISALIYGWIEGELWPHAEGSFQFVIGNHFTWYHVAFFALFAVIGLSSSVTRVFKVGKKVWYLIVASGASMAWGFWLEDMSYFATTYSSTTPGLQRGVWVEWGLGGFQTPILGNYVPSMYVLLSLAAFVTFAFAFLLARRDILRDLAVGYLHTALTINSVKSSVVRAVLISLSTGIVLELWLVFVPALTSVYVLTVVGRIISIGICTLLPAMFALSIIDIEGRHYLATLK